MTNSAAIMERYSQVMFPAAAPYHGDNPLVAERAKDQYIWDIEEALSGFLRRHPDRLGWSLQ